MNDVETLPESEGLVDQFDAGFDTLPHIEEAPPLANNEQEPDEPVEKSELDLVENKDPAAQILSEAIGGETEHWEFVDSRQGIWMFNGEKILNPETGETYSGGPDSEAALAIQQEAARQWNEPGGSPYIVVPGHEERTENGIRIHGFLLVLGKEREDGTREVGWQWHIHEIEFAPEEEKEKEEEKGKEGGIQDGALLHSEPEVAEVESADIVPQGPWQLERAHEALVEHPTDTFSDREGSLETAETASAEGSVNAPSVVEAPFAPFTPENMTHPGETERDNEMKSVEPLADVNGFTNNALESLPVFESREATSASTETGARLDVSHAQATETPDMRDAAIHQILMQWFSRDTLTTQVEIPGPTLERAEDASLTVAEISSHREESEYTDVSHEIIEVKEVEVSESHEATTNEHDRASTPHSPESHVLQKDELETPSDTAVALPFDESEDFGGSIAPLHESQPLAAPAVIDTAPILQNTEPAIQASVELFAGNRDADTAYTLPENEPRIKEEKERNDAPTSVEVLQYALGISVSLPMSPDTRTKIFEVSRGTSPQSPRQTISARGRTNVYTRDGITLRTQP